MLVAAYTDKTSGRRVLVLGLFAENMRRLANDEPIYKRLDTPPQDVPGLGDWDVTILGPEDTARFVATFGPEQRA